MYYNISWKLCWNELHYQERRDYDAFLFEVSRFWESSSMFMNFNSKILLNINWFFRVCIPENVIECNPAVKILNTFSPNQRARGAFLTGKLDTSDHFTRDDWRTRPKVQKLSLINWLLNHFSKCGNSTLTVQVFFVPKWLSNSPLSSGTNACFLVCW